MDKSTRQTIGINKWIKANGVGTFDYIQRFGKTLTALKIVIKLNKQFPDDKAIVVVPNVGIKKVWHDEIELYDYDFKNIEVYTITTVLNFDNPIECKLLIIDEIHNYTSDKRLELIKGNIIKARYRVGLTGTYPYNHIIINQYYPVIDVIEEKEALENKWVAPYIEYNIPLQLTMSDKLEYINYSSTISEVLYLFKGLHKLILVREEPLFENELQVVLGCYRGTTINNTFIKSKYIRDVVASNMGWMYGLELKDQYNKNIEKNWSPESIKKNARLFYIAMRARNDIHNENTVKLKAVLDIYKRFKDNHFIIFNESTLFADVITESLNNRYPASTMAYHSKIESKPLFNFFTKEYFTTVKGSTKKYGKKKILDYINEYFRHNIFNVISTVRALDEGLNIENINIIICTSGTANPVQYSQRSARGKTIDKYNDNKRTIIINLYFDDFEAFDNNGINRLYKSRDRTKLLTRVKSNNVREINLHDLINYVKIS